MVRIGIDMAEFSRCCDWELVGIIEPLVEESAHTMQLIDCDERIPVGYCAPAARPGMQVVTRKAARIGKQSCARNVRARDNTVRDLLRVRCFAVEEQLSIELARAPAVEHSANVVN